MAIPIRSVPVLEGEVARRFIKEAKENEKNVVLSNFWKKKLLPLEQLLQMLNNEEFYKIWSIFVIIVQCFPIPLK
jgi:hypothetical protein